MNVFWQKLEFHPCEFWFVHWSVEVKVLEVKAQESGAWGGDDAVEKHLDGEQVSGGYANVAVEVDSAAVHGESSFIDLQLLGSFAAHNPAVGDILPFLPRHFRAVNEVDGVGVVIPA